MAQPSTVSVINIIHFNDVYNINPIVKKDADGNITSISGGASRFKSFINTLAPVKPIILFRFVTQLFVLRMFIFQIISILAHQEDGDNKYIASTNLKT